MAVLELLHKAGADGDTDFLREGPRTLAEAIMEAEVSELTGLPKGERTPDRRLGGGARSSRLLGNEARRVARQSRLAHQRSATFPSLSGRPMKRPTI